jgi:Caspase domain/MORN repeat
MLKKIILGLLILRGLSNLNAQCIEGDCRNGIGTAVFKKSDGVRYTGQFKNKRPNGRGVADYPNGRRYEGEWVNGVWQGQGKLTLTDGSSLTGGWYNGKFKSRIKYAPTSSPDALQNGNTDVAKTNDSARPNDGFEEAKRYDRSTSNQPLKIDDKEPHSEIWSLAIGIADYDNPTIPRLKYPDNDAWSMYSFWKSPMGGALDDDHLDILVDDAATKANIEFSMKKMFKQAKTNDVVCFFFSGHGLKGSFLPNDYDGDRIRLYHNDINKMLNDCPAKYKLVIADACHSGSYIASKSPQKPSAEAIEIEQNQYYDDLTKAHPGTAYMLSSLAEEESLEVSSLKNSVFTYFVIRGLKGEANANGDEKVTVKELFDFVSLNVKNYAANLGKVQTPIIKGDYDPDMPVSILKR